MGEANPEHGAEVFEQARIAFYSSLRGTFEALPCKSLILFIFNPLRDATTYGNEYIYYKLLVSIDYFLLKNNN